MKLPHRNFFLAPFFLSCLIVPAAEEPGLLVEPRLSVSSDVQAGVRAGLYGVPGGSGPFEVFLDVEGRLFPHRVRERVSPTFSYQYRETRLTLGPGVSYAMPLGSGWSFKDWFLVTGAGAGYSFANYRGTARAAESGWTAWGEAGVRYDAGNYYWGAAMEVRPLPRVAPVRLLLRMGWKL